MKYFALYIALVVASAATFYYAGDFYVAVAICAYLLALVVCRAIGWLGLQIPESKFERMHQDPEFGGYKSLFTRAIVRFCYEFVCHFGLWKNDIVVRGMMRARHQ